jgi:hypothetical protein
MRQRSHGAADNGSTWGAIAVAASWLMVTALATTSAVASPAAAASLPAGMDGVAAAVLFGLPMPAPEATATVPIALQTRLADYRKREAAFRSTLTPPPGATPDEQRSFEQRVGIERVVFCLFDRRDSGRIAALYALDVDVETTDWERSPEQPRREANFINQLLTDLPQPWLAPYLNLVAGHRRLCASQIEGEDGADAPRARGQLGIAAKSGHPLIRAIAEHLITTARPCSPSI